MNFIDISLSHVTLLYVLTKSDALFYTCDGALDNVLHSVHAWSINIQLRFDIYISVHVYIGFNLTCPINDLKIRFKYISVMRAHTSRK